MKNKLNICIDVYIGYIWSQRFSISIQNDEIIQIIVLKQVTQISLVKLSDIEIYNRQLMNNENRVIN